MGRKTTAILEEFEIGLIKTKSNWKIQQTTEGKKCLTVRVKMPDKSTLHTVTGARTRTLYALLKNARIFQPYFENEVQSARLCPKPS